MSHLRVRSRAARTHLTGLRHRLALKLNLDVSQISVQCYRLYERGTQSNRIGHSCRCFLTMMTPVAKGLIN